MPLITDRAPASASPLWIIALFIALSEVTAGAASVITSGSARLIFACFAVTFPTLVLVIFVWLLVKHAPKLYAPGQYSRDITPEMYRIGVSRMDATVLGQAVAKTVVLGEARADQREGEGEEEETHVKIDRFARIFEGVIEESRVEIEVVPPGNLVNPIIIHVSGRTQVYDFLNEVWFELQGAVDPYTYGSSWVLTDKATRHAYTDVGRVWARRNGLDEDSRLLSDIGIKPQDKLQAIIINDKDSE